MPVSAVPGGDESDLGDAQEGPLARSVVKLVVPGSCGMDSPVVVVVVVSIVQQGVHGHVEDDKEADGMADTALQLDGHGRTGVGLRGVAGPS
mmetsp:Transcript_90809/g.163961  ORF Transcript_90809/g.163961 Transcript_90809/m.163961 type:complete len:92 (-) Transcript_90809:88-363(-)